MKSVPILSSITLFLAPPSALSPMFLDTEASPSPSSPKSIQPHIQSPPEPPNPPTQMMMICHENKAVTTAPPPPPPPPALAPGFRFHPTDEELVRYYLTRKVCGKSCRIDAISEADIYKMEPWDLPGLSKMRSRDLEWYFYSALDKKYGNGARMNRATSTGYWKATGNDRSVRNESRVVGMKKTLVFHKGRAPGGKRTNWVMHEYRLVDEELEKSGVIKEGFVLCRVFQKSAIGPPNGDQYAPFDESEWADDQPVLVPGAEAGDEVQISDEAQDGSVLEGNGQVQDEIYQDVQPEKTSQMYQDVRPLNTCQRYQDVQPDKTPQMYESIQPEKTEREMMERDFLGTAFVCKNEKRDDWQMPSIMRAKKPRFMGSGHTLPSKSSSSSSSSVLDPSLSMKSVPTMADAAAVAARTLLEFPLLSAAETKENPQPTMPPGRFDIAAFDMPVHPTYIELINNLQNEIHGVSNDREKLRIEMMHAKAMIDVLQSRVYFLQQENEELKRSA